MMKLISVCVIVIIWMALFPPPLGAQQSNNLPDYRNELFVEILGSGIPYSLNYSRFITQKGTMQFWLKAGGSYFGQFRHTLNISDDSMISGNIEPKVIFGNDRNKLEAGLGYLFVYWFDITRCEPKLWYCHEYSHIIFPRTGYRHYTKNKRWIFSIGWTPAYETYIDFRGSSSGEISPLKTKSFHWLYGGIGIGWRF